VNKQCPKYFNLYPRVLIIKLSLPKKFFFYFWSYQINSKILKD
jgi:hypothetical protein